MTASKTPNLGLSNPVSTDPFSTADFADSFTKIDQTPGVTVVPNQASRPTGWSSAQHGRMVWQADLNCLWVWYQPSSGTPGVWKRSGNVGWLGGTINADAINTTAMDWNSGPVICNINLMVPGGRPCLVIIEWKYFYNTHNGQGLISAVENNNIVQEWMQNGWGFGLPVGSTNVVPHGGSLAYVHNSPSTQQSVTFQVRCRSENTASAGSYWGGGTTSLAYTSLNVFEL